MNKKLLFGLVFMLLVSFASVFAVTNDSIQSISYDSNFDDESSNANNPTNSGVTIISTGVKVGNGSGEYSSGDYLVNPTLIQNKASFSVCTWLKPDAVATNQVIYEGWGTGGASGFKLIFRIDSSGDLTFFTYTTAQVGGVTQSFGGAGVWKHVCATYDGTTMKTYVDSDVGATTYAQTGTIQNSGQPEWWGKSPFYASTDFIGDMDQSMIYDRALSQAEVDELYNSGAGCDPYGVGCGVSPIEYVLKVIGKDADSLASLSSLNVTWDGTTYTNATGNIVSINITAGGGNASNLQNFSVVSENYFIENVTNWNISTNYQANLTGLPLKDFEIVTPNQTITTDDTFNITWTQAVSPTSKVVTYNGTIAYETNSSVVDTFSTTNLSYIQNVSTFASQNYSVTIEATEASTGDNFSHTNYLGVDRPNYLYFYDEESGNPIENASITITLPHYSDDLSLQTDSNGAVTFNSYYNSTLQTGNYSITFEDFIGFVTPVTFTEKYNNLPINESFNISVVNIEAFLFYRSNFSTFTKNATVIIEGIANFTTSNGTIEKKNASITNGDYRITVSSDGYFNEEKTFTYTGQDDIDVNIYLLEINQSNSGTVTIRTVDEFSRLLGDSTVRLLEYDSNTLSYIEVSECTTDTNGECKFLVETNTKSYKFTASKVVNGNTVTASTEPQIFEDDISGGQIVLFSEETITLTLSSLEQYELNPIQNIIYNSTESFNNVTNESNIDVSFKSIDGTNLQVCVEYFSIDGGVETSLTGSTFCVTASSAEVTENAFFTLNRSKEYVAKVYIINGNSEILLEQYRYKSLDSFQQRLINNATLPFIFLFIWIFLIGGVLALKNVPLVGISIIVGAWVIGFFFPSITIISGSVIQTLIGISLIYNGRKKEDFK